MFDKNKDGFITKEEFAQAGWGRSTSERVVILNVFIHSLLCIRRFGAQTPCMRALTIDFGLMPPCSYKIKLSGTNPKHKRSNVNTTIIQKDVFRIRLFIESATIQ